MKAFESDVLLARDGDSVAFTRLVDGCAGTVSSIALAIVRNVEASEDIAQEAFLAAWRNLGKLHNPASFLPWLKQVTRNQAHLWRREHARELSDDAILEAASDPRPTAEQALLRDEQQRVIREVLGELDDDAREVLVLYYREGRSTAQVAELLEMSEAAVRQRVARARAELRDEVLERFGRAVAQTAPGAAFGAAIGAALVASAPTATAAVMTSKGVSAALGVKGTVAAATLAGGLFGWFGVMMGMKSLEPIFDEQEGRELVRFRNMVLAVVTIGCGVIAMSRSSKLLSVFAIQSVYLAIIVLYAWKLPRILERRLAWERSVDPAVATQTRRKWMWATIKGAVSAAIGGAVGMAILLSGFW